MIDYVLKRENNFNIMTESYTAKFTIGQVVHHKKFDYRGVILDVDPVFNGTEEWYENVAVSRPPKDKPWYHVIVEGSDQQRYVAERHLETDKSGEPINHPMVDKLFSGFDNGVYRNKETMN